MAGVLLAGDGARRIRSHVAPLASNSATDALPLYLYPRTVEGGGDPTVQEDLAAAYLREHLTTRAATFSNLYPATITPLMRPLAQDGWAPFVATWRDLLLCAGAIAGACGAAAGARQRALLPTVALAALGAGLALRVFPVTPHCVALGQANLAIGALLGVTMLAWSRRANATSAGAWALDGVGGVALGMGIGLKLVPAIGLPFALLSRRWASLATCAATLAVLLACTLPGQGHFGVPWTRVVAGVQGAMAFHAALVPDWIWADGATPLESLVNAARHLPLLALTLLLGALRVTTRPDRGAASAGALALAAAWLATDSAAVHWLYTPLLLPTLAWVGTWPLAASSRAERLVAVGAAGLTVVGWTLWAHDWLPLTAFPRMVVASAFTWLAAAVRVLWEGAPWRRREAIALSLGLCLAGGGSLWRVAHPAPISPLPAGVGNGGPKPGGGGAAPRPPGRPATH